MIKKEYNIDDEVWIHGIDRRNNKLVKGIVIHKIEIPKFTDLHYIVSIATPIEPLLEIRTWHTMSQDENGPVGMFRDMDRHSLTTTQKFVSKVGFEYSQDDEDFDEPTPEQIAAAIEKSQKLAEHPPLNLRPNSAKRKRYIKRKKHE